MKRTLTLKREALAELSADDLRGVVGGVSGATCPIDVCFDDLSDNLGCVGTHECLTRSC